MAERLRRATFATMALLAGCGLHQGDPAGAAIPTSTASVIRTDIVSRQQLPGTLTYAGSYTVINQAGPGVYTSLAAPGTVASRGAVLYRVDGRPIPLLYGDPQWRRLSAGVLDGPDVYALQANLSALGFGAGLRVDQHFDWATAAAVRRWQAALGVAPTGAVDPGDAVYMPGPLRVASVQPTVGMLAQPGQPVMAATSPQHAVLLPVDVARASQVRAGDPVTVTLPDGKTTASGRVAAIGTIALAPGDTSGQAGGGNAGPPAASVIVTITLTDAAAGGSLDQAPVEVGLTYDVHAGVLAVPVVALLAEPGGTYAVEVVEGAQRRLVAVTTGLFDDRGLVEVSGLELREGMAVEVPRP